MAEELVTHDERTLALADGSPIPTLGLGVWQVDDGAACEQAVEWALELGYRHIDTAQAYRNESSVGRAMRASGVPRDEIFLTTKFFPRQHKDPAAEAEKSLERLGVDFVDLYLVHWPEGGPTWAWPGMQAAQEKGHARSIGVSNFSTAELTEVMALGGAAPSVNQVQFSPFEYRRALQDACAERKVAIEAYSPLGTGRHLSDAVVAEIAARLGKSSAQVLVRWCLQRGTIVLPKSTHRERIEENARVYDFVLSPDDMATLDGLDTTGGAATARDDAWW